VLQLGRTEMVLNNLNPNFAKSVTVDYYFEEVQKLKLQVYDVDSPSQALQAHDFLGEVECTLGHVSRVLMISMSARHRCLHFCD